jgi:hypothetical protein
MLCHICEGHTDDTYHCNRCKHFALCADNYSYPKHCTRQKKQLFLPRVAKLPRASLPEHIYFTGWRLIFVDFQHGTYLVPTHWCLEFLDDSYIFGK